MPHPVRIFSSLLPVPNKEQQRKVSQLARTLLLLSRWIVISFVVLLPRFVRAFVRVRGFVICAHAWGDASNLGSSSVEGVTDAHLFFAAVGSDGRHGMADPVVGFGDYSVAF